jgi:hypothetical protein
VKIRYVVFPLVLITVCFSPGFGKNQWKTNIYESSVSNVALDLSADSEEEKNANAQKVLLGKEKWCDAFIEQNPGKLSGVVAFKGKVRAAGIGYDSISVKARSIANKNCLAALEGSGLNEMGMYATVLRIWTQNGYYVYAILRSPVSKGFRIEDFQDQSDDVIRTITDE